MTKLSDMTVFKIIFAVGALSYSIFIFGPADLNIAFTYTANCIFVGSLGGMQNLGSLVSELRVPPQSLGSVNMIAYTAAVGIGAIVPFISQMSGQWPLILAATYSIICFFAMFFLPEAGQYLPVAAEADAESATIDRTLNAASVIDEFEKARQAPLASYAMH